MIHDKDRSRRMKKNIVITIFSMIVSIALYLIYKNILISLISLVSVIIIFSLFFYFKNKLKEAARISKIESVFPDFLQLMSSNLRAGMTVSKAMLLSAREEFSPLDSEILRVGKDITTGKDTETALLDMAKRINSEKIRKTLLLIISGIKAGGNLSVLLEETASNMRERSFMEKRASSNVLMYVIFIFVAVSVAAPALFALSNILVEVMTNLLKGLPETTSAVSLPFTMSKINISLNFINYFSIAFMLVIDILASLVLGLVSKGEEKEGLRYLIPILIISMSVFFAMKFFLSNFLAGLF